MAALPPVDVALLGDDDGAVERLLVRQQEAGAVNIVDGPEPTALRHVVGWSAARVASRSALGPWVLSPPATDGAGAQRSLLLSADAVVVRTSQERDEVHALGVPWFRLEVVPRWVDVSVFRRPGAAARRTPRRRVVIEAGDSADAVLAAVAAWDAVEVVVLSRGISGRAALALRRLARRTGVAQRLVLVEPRDAAERAWWIRSADVVAVVPRTGGDSALALEAMACGVPVVATPMGALEDLVVHGVTGLHVPPADPLSLARGLRSLLTDPFVLEAFGMAGSDRAASRYSPERVGRDLVGVYRRVLARRAASEVDGGEPDEVDDGAAEADSASTGVTR